jgi:hypothetical protein
VGHINPPGDGLRMIVRRALIPQIHPGQHR